MRPRFRPCFWRLARHGPGTSRGEEEGPDKIGKIPIGTVAFGTWLNFGGTDGNWLVFTRSPKQSGEGPMDLWIMRPDGSDLTQITRNAKGVFSYAPAWGK